MVVCDSCPSRLRTDHRQLWQSACLEIDGEKPVQDKERECLQWGE